MKPCKFHGRFRDLIPAGFVFQKLFANNYRCYRKATALGDTITVWQHCGGYVEINDYYAASGLIIAAILRNETPGKYGFWVIDQQNNILLPFDPVEHDITKRLSMGLMPDVDTIEGKAAFEQHLARWRRVGLEDETIEEIKRMAEHGWLKPE